jgi:hypothetical protein
MIRRSVGPSADLAACELDGETRLPDPSRAGQRHQPGAAQRLADAFELADPADQRRQEHWGVVPGRAPPLGRFRDGRRHHEGDHHTPTAAMSDQRSARSFAPSLRRCAITLPTAAHTTTAKPTTTSHETSAIATPISPYRRAASPIAVGM